MSWIQTFSGQLFYPAAPRPENVRLADVAHSLSLICRFAGHCRCFYSVAQHCVYTAEWLLNLFAQKHEPNSEQARGVALLGLLHDAAEAYMGDIPRSVKAQLREAKHIEDRLLRVILPVLAPGLDKEFLRSAWPYVKTADNALLGAEARDLFNGGCVEDWHMKLGVLPAEVRIVPCGPDKAEALFHDMYLCLSDGEL